MKFIINQRLPSLNDVINKNRANKYYANDFKQDIEERIGWDIRQAITSGMLRRTSEPCEVYISWHEKTKRRDVENIQSSTKFILDAIVKNGVLPNDNRRYVKQVYHKIYDSDRDYVVVELLPVEQ